MTKEEILEKSRKENSFMDERQKKLDTRSDTVSWHTVMFVCLSLNFLNLFCDGPEIVTTVTWLIIGSLWASKYLCRAILLKRRGDLIVGISWAVTFFYRLFVFIASIF